MLLRDGRSGSKDGVKCRDIDSKSLKHTQKSKQKKSWRNSHTLFGLYLTTNLSAQLASGLTISQYSASHPRKSTGRIEILFGICTSGNAINGIDKSTTRLRPEDVVTQLELSTRARSCISVIPVPNFIHDPSAATFVNAVMIYGLAVLIFYNIRKGDRYQDHFLLLGVLCGILAGTITSWRELDLEAVKDYVPMAITAALMLSFVSHVALAWFGSPGKRAEVA